MIKRYSSQIEPLDVSSTDFKPLGGQFLGSMERKQVSDGGIIYAVPETTWWVDVAAVGPDCDFAPGDCVLVEEFRGENIDLLDGEFTIFNDANCLAVMDG